MKNYIKSVEFVASVFTKNDFPKPLKYNFIVIGKSNVGKSSFINSITNKKRLAFTSSTPGKTQSLNFYLINKKFYLIDLPGYGYGKVSILTKKKWTDILNHYFNTINSLKYCFLLIDVRREEPDELDKQIIDFMHNNMIPIYYVLTKIDKLGKSKIEGAIQKFCSKLNIERDYVIPFSSLKKIGIDKIYNIFKIVIE